ncbi:hypothetical protein PE067_00725 [Paracoccus sp. DMF-8]|nr:hypothetical protein [Paracoccus sp. DMF-8]MDF3604810.1 hypothetical protein [Paracoccus sp. DMF-8]
MVDQATAMQNSATGETDSFDAGTRRKHRSTTATRQMKPRELARPGPRAG